MMVKTRIEFDLTVKKFGVKDDFYCDPMRNDNKKKEEELETLNFKSLSAVEVLRKLLDYLKD